jgi:hypothetical protein
LQLRGGNLHYRPFEKTPLHALAETKKTTKVLYEFLELSDASDAEILDYARRFGVLGLCEQHECTVGHPFALHKAEEPSAIFPGGPLEHCAPSGWPNECREPLALWRRWAARFGTLLRLSIELRHGRSGELDDWYLLAPGLKLEKAFAQRHREGFWAGLLEKVNQILSFAPQRLRWGVEGKSLVEDRLLPSPPLVLRFVPFSYYGALWSALSIKLAFAAAGAKDLSFCSNCGKLFEVPHKPPTGTHTYCHRLECKRAALRLASRTYYKQHREAVLKRKKERARGTKTQRG